MFGKLLSVGIGVRGSSESYVGPDVLVHDRHAAPLVRTYLSTQSNLVDKYTSKAPLLLLPKPGRDTYSGIISDSSKMIPKPRCLIPTTTCGAPTYPSQLEACGNPQSHVDVQLARR
jgi:hypothetical protein